MDALRVVALASLLAGALLSGCTQTADLQAALGGPAAADAPAHDSRGIPVTLAPDANATVEGCKSESGCDFWDDDYHEYTVYDVDTPAIDVLVVPPASPAAMQEVAVVKEAVTAWGEGVQALGEDWFRDNFTLNTYVVGLDVVPPEALADPEIVVFAAEFNPALLFGIGLEPAALLCQAIGQDTLHAYPDHQHGDVLVRAANCANTGFLCYAINTNFALNEQGLVYMQDLVAHEVGHCLGGGHVGDALDFKAKAVPFQDIMSYEHGDAVHCVSNLNVRVLEDVYASLVGRPELDLLEAGDFYAMNATAYRHVVCPTGQLA